MERQGDSTWHREVAVVVEQARWSHMCVWQIKIGRETLGVRDPSPRTDCTAQGSSARKINFHDFWL